ncbi:hypothetical protein D3C72_1790020 [compost metagenome]
MIVEAHGDRLGQAPVRLQLHAQRARGTHVEVAIDEAEGGLVLPHREAVAERRRPEHPVRHDVGGHRVHLAGRIPHVEGALERGAGQVGAQAHAKLGDLQVGAAERSLKDRG